MALKIKGSLNIWNHTKSWNTVMVISIYKLLNFAGSLDIYHYLSKMNGLLIRWIISA